MATYTDNQLRRGGKAFAATFKAHPEAAPQELAVMLGEPVEKVLARIASRDAYITAKVVERATERNRRVPLPLPERETEKGVCFKLAFEVAGYYTHKGSAEYEHRPQSWNVWFPKSQLEQAEGGAWTAPGWLFDIKIAEAVAEIDANQPNGAMRHASFKGLPENAETGNVGTPLAMPVCRVRLPQPPIA